jgi:predicted metal-dependent phosphoesterase TrpH
VIDLHTHSNESDGSLSPLRLIAGAVEAGLEALAVTDHDTLAGYDLAAAAARASGLDLVCAVELGTLLTRQGKLPVRHVHLLAYFLDHSPPQSFRDWLGTIHASRRDRNRLLAEKLRSLGLDVRAEEAENLGRSVTGRPHFARLLVQKGFVATVEEAFTRFLSDAAKAFVPRRVPSFAEAAEQILAARALPVLAHPGRLVTGRPHRLEGLVRAMVEQGLRGIEAYHSDHTAADTEQALGLAAAYGLAVSGGSDFHGEAKPGVEMGTGRGGNLAIPLAVLDRMREFVGENPRRVP